MIPFVWWKLPRRPPAPPIMSQNMWMARIQDDFCTFLALFLSVVMWRKTASPSAVWKILARSKHKWKIIMISLKMPELSMILALA
jgi:hypothetical protein